MVFFTCNACGQSIKKNKVEKHYQVECRSCEILSCMDCGKEFAGDEYLSHTSCISEAEKYQGALFSESNKGQVPKGEKKQQEWLERIRKSVLSAAANPRIANLLERIADYPNIPRKKPKFVNFVRNSFNVRDERTLEQLWDAFSAATKPSPNVDDGQSKPAAEETQKVESVSKELGQTSGADGDVSKELGQTSGADGDVSKEQKPSKKQKCFEKASEGVTGGKGSAGKCETAGICDQNESTAQHAGCDGNIEAASKEETAAVLKKAKRKKLQEMETVVVKETVSEDVEEPPKKKSKTRNIGSCVQKGCTTELTTSSTSSLESEEKTAEKHQESEGGVVFQEDKSKKKKKKLDAVAVKDDHSTNVGSEIKAVGEVRKKSRKTKAKGDDCVQKDCTSELVPSTTLPLEAAEKHKSQDSVNGVRGVAFQESGESQASKKKKRKQDTVAMQG